MARLLRNHRQIMYQLRRDWGLEVSIYRPLDRAHDILTGEITSSFEIHTVPRAPVLIATDARNFVYDLAYIAVGKNFTEGAFFDGKQRWILLDARELAKGFVPTLNDFVVFKTLQYEIKRIEHVEELAAYRLTVVAIRNQEKVRWLTAKNAIGFLEEAAGTI